MGWDIPLGCGVRTQLRPLLLGLTGTQLTLLMVLCCWSESSIGAAPRVPQIHSLRRGQWQGRAPPPKRAVPCCVSHTAIQGGHGEAGLSSQKYLCPPKHCCWGPASWLEITLSGVAFRGQGRPTPGRSVLLLPTVVDGKWRFLSSHTGLYTRAHSVTSACFRHSPPAAVHQGGGSTFPCSATAPGRQALTDRGEAQNCLLWLVQGLCLLLLSLNCSLVQALSFSFFPWYFPPLPFEEEE